MAAQTTSGLAEERILSAPPLTRPSAAALIGAAEGRIFIYKRKLLIKTTFNFIIISEKFRLERHRCGAEARTFQIRGSRLFVAFAIGLGLAGYGVWELVGLIDSLTGRQAVRHCFLATASWIGALVVLVQFGHRLY